VTQPPSWPSCTGPMLAGVSIMPRRSDDSVAGVPVTISCRAALLRTPGRGPKGHCKNWAAGSFPASRPISTSGGPTPLIHHGCRCRYAPIWARLVRHSRRHAALSRAQRPLAFR
jgi:hypothetical protein